MIGTMEVRLVGSLIKPMPSGPASPWKPSVPTMVIAKVGRATATRPNRPGKDEEQGCDDEQGDHHELTIDDADDADDSPLIVALESDRRRVVVDLFHDVGQQEFGIGQPVGVAELTQLGCSRS